MTRQTENTPLKDLCWVTAQAAETFTYASLAADRGCSVPTAEAIVKRWRSDGLIEDRGTGYKGRKIFAVRPQHKRPRSVDGIALREQSPEDNMWTAMRQLRTFTAQDVAVAAATDQIALDQAIAQKYIWQLMCADVPYVKVVQKAKARIRPAAYQLVRNSGPKAPRQMRIRALWDDNLSCYTYIPDGRK